jgi:chemotaxis protein MotD
MPNDKSGQAADADFGKQLADMATGDERPARSAAAREDREPPASGWRQWGAKFARLDGDRCGVPEAVAAEAVPAGEEGDEVKAALPAADPVVVDDGLVVVSANSIPPNPTAVPTGPVLPLAVMSIDAALTVPLSPPVHPEGPRSLQAMWIDPPPSITTSARDGVGPERSTAPRTAANGAGSVPSIPQGSAADATGLAQANAISTVQGVSVIGREMHLAPSTPSPAPRQVSGHVAAEATSRDGQASADIVGVPAEEAKPSASHSIPAAARSQDGSHWPAQRSPGGASAPQTSLQARAAAAATGSQPQAASAEDVGLKAAPVRSAGPSTAAGQETSPPIQPPSSPVQQIADRIAAEISPTGGHGRTDAVAALPINSTVQPLKVLTVQLHPAELGVVTIRIALRNDTLELQIETDRHDTARLVHADRESLASQLRSAGYGVETLTVRAVDPSSAPAPLGSSSPGSPDGAPQSQAGGSQPDARASGGRAHAEQDRNLHGSRRDSNDEQDGARHRPGDGLYV